MEALLRSYRNLTVLLVVVVAQLLYLAYQVKSTRDERLIRVWAVSAVTPMAGVVEALRRNTIGFLEDYFILLDVRDQNRRLKRDNDRLRIENVYYRNQLSTAEHAHALVLFQAQSPSKTVAARVIGNSTVATAKAVFIDRGSTSGIEKEMAVVTPDGIVGKVTAAYPLVAQVLLVTDPTFKVGVESQKNHVHGVLNCGSGRCQVEQIQNEEKIDSGEWFYTSGEDRIFPRGFPVGTVVSSQPGQGTKDVKLDLSGAPAGVEEVLVVLQGVHQQVPVAPTAQETVAKSLPVPPPDTTVDPDQPVKSETQADKVMQKYDAMGKEQNHVYGGLGSNLPNFNPPNFNPPNFDPRAAAAQAKPSVAVNDSEPATKTASSADADDDEAPEPHKPAPRLAAPALLGARPGTHPIVPATAAPTASTKAAPPKLDPALPLGAPRRKVVVPPATATQAPRPAPPTALQQ